VINLKEILQRDSVTEALTEVYGPVQLKVLSQKIVEDSAEPYRNFFGATSGSLLERRIKLLVHCQNRILPVVSAVSWIRLDALSTSAKEDLQNGVRMLGAILADEKDLQMHDYGIDCGTSSETSRELLLPDTTLLIFRWRYWSKPSGERVVLLCECAPPLSPEPGANSVCLASTAVAQS
jgi:chorismate-pyruvate lyase